MVRLTDRPDTTVDVKPMQQQQQLTDSKHEVRKAANDFCPFLLPFRSLELPPEWSSFDGVPPGSINRLINNLKDDYYMALGQQIIY